MGSTKQPTIVIINDNPVQLRMTSALLERDGMKVDSFPDAEEALSSMKKNGLPELIITDLNMPGIDGWRLCRLLRSTEYAAFNEVPILVLSATYACAESEEIVLALGANAFLAAPCEPDVLRKNARALLESRPVSTPKRVLIVDDDKGQVKILEHSFKKRGFNVMTANSVNEGRQLLFAPLPDVVVLDYYLSDMTGDVLLENIKKPGSSTIVVMITSDDDPERAVQLVNKGVDGYVRKPFAPEYLIDLCEKARQQQALIRVEKLMEERSRQLQESEKRYRKMVTAITNYTYTVRTQCGVSVFAGHTHGCFAVTGYTSEDYASNPDLWPNIVYPNDGEKVRQHLKKVYAGEDMHPVEHRIVHRNGNIRWVRHTIVLNRDQYGTIMGHDGLVEDITERKQLEEHLREAHASQKLFSSCLAFFASKSDT